MICDNMTALPYSKSNKDKDFHVALWNKCTIETECQLHYNMNWFTYDTLYSEGPSLCICDSGTHSNRGSRCENYVCTTYYRHVRFTPSSMVPCTLQLTTWCLTQQKNSANKERGHLIQHCQGIMIADDSDTDSARCLKGKQGVPGPGVTVYRGVVTVLTCAPVSPPV